MNQCPYAFSTTCEQYRLQGLRCQDCPELRLDWGEDDASTVQRPTREPTP